MSGAIYMVNSAPLQHFKNNTERACNLLVNKKKIRVLIAKVGLDGHDVGAKVIARGLSDAGMEVIYTGLRQTPDLVVGTAIQEDVDVIGISLLSGAHMVFLPEILRLLKENEAKDIAVIGGGVIPVEDIVTLKTMGVKEIFPAGSSLQEAITCIENICREKQMYQIKKCNCATTMNNNRYECLQKNKNE